MTKEEWEELEKLSVIYPYTDRFEELAAMTEQEDEHPDGYDGPCLCRSCMSYSDLETEETKG